MEDRNIIIVENLVAGYGDNIILSGVSFGIRRGEIFIILGGSGCGKSTLLKYMIGLYRTDRGRVLIDGDDIMAADDKKLKSIRLGFGVLFQSGALIGSMTLAENVALPLTRRRDIPAELRNLIVRMKLGMVDLDGYENHYPAELSGGMKKRAGLARAMVLDPTILFFDEPTAGLDPVTSTEICTLIRRINDDLGTTMIIVTHDLDLIMSIGDRAIMLDKAAQGIIAEGTPRMLKDKRENPMVFGFFNREEQGDRRYGA
jgi:phospholipid/cholesterol/gamma-HCH transport system ATP-binding protein